MTVSSDRNKRLSYELARIIAARLVKEPSLVEEGRRYLDRHMRGKPRQQRYYDMWSDLLRKDVREIATRLLAQDSEGELLRDTRPVFYVPTHQERTAALEKARLPLA